VVVLCSAWCFVAWQLFPGVGVDGVDHELWRTWAYAVPYGLGLVILLSAWVTLSVYFTWRGHGWLAVLLTFYYFGAVVAQTLGCVMWARMKVFE
jgi:hypothetical protein